MQIVFSRMIHGAAVLEMEQTGAEIPEVGVTTLISDQKIAGKNMTTQVAVQQVVVLGRATNGINRYVK